MSVATASAAVVPSILQQVFATGDAVTGVEYTGTADVERTSDAYPARNGRIYRQTKDGGDPAIDGGLFLVGNLRDRIYSQLDGFIIKLPGCTLISVYLVDEDGLTYDVSKGLSLTAPSGDTFVAPDLERAWHLLPGWNVKVVGNAVLTGPGSITLIFSDWAYPAPFVTF